MISSLHVLNYKVSKHERKFGKYGRKHTLGKSNLIEFKLRPIWCESNQFQQFNMLQFTYTNHSSHTLIAVKYIIE